MGKFLINDFKRALRSRGSKIYLMAGIVLILVANIAVICFRFIYGSNEGTFSYNVYEYASWCFLIPYYSCIAIGWIVFGHRYPHPKKEGITLTEGGVKHTFKPAQLYIEKLIVSVMLAAVYLVVAFVAFYVITQLFHIDEGITLWPVVKNFLEKTALSLPLWFAGICFAIMFLFIFETWQKALAGYVILTVIIPQIIRIFSLDTFKFELARTIRRYTITQSFGLVPYPSYPDRSVPLIVALGLIYGILASVIGIVIYSRKADRS